MTDDDLREAEAYYQRAYRRYEQARENRNATVRAAIAEGWTHARISEATSLTRSRIGQIALGHDVTKLRATIGTLERERDEARRQLRGAVSDATVETVANAIWPLADLSSDAARDRLREDVRRGLEAAGLTDHSRGAV